MHPALCLEEILLNVFGQCYPSTTSRQGSVASRATADLAALARTCRTFKEPALDVLWTELANLSPLARCLPEVSHQIYPASTWYSFTRPLVQAEWGILRSYTRRVRSVLDFTRDLNWESVKVLLNPPTPEPMFPNLRILRWEFMRETFPLMHHLAVPPLTSLEINLVFGDVPPFHSFPLSLADLCPNMRRIWIRMRRPQAASDEAISTLVRRWTNLQVLYCPYINLDVDSLLHLSRTPSLTNLSFALNGTTAEQILSSRSTLLFPRLRDLEISCPSLEPISRLLPYIQLPSLKSFTLYIDSCPSKYTLKSYLTALQKVCTNNSLVSIKLVQTRSSSFTNHDSERYQLTLEDIRPCMSFGQLRRIDINTAWTVNLTDNDILELASAWPHLERLLINEEWGWGNEGGVTPTGLLQVLERLQALRHFCLAIDTRGHADIPRIFDTTRTSKLASCVPFSVNVVDSFIQPESVDALASFFGGIMRQHANVSSCYWDTTAMADRLDSEISRRLWEDVFMKAHEKVRAYSQGLRTGQTLDV